MADNEAGRREGRSRMLTDGEIAEAAQMWPIGQVAAEKLGVPDEALVPYGHHMAKLETSYLH
ncbi:MAG TPA: formate--tetrahydrofolate ligase, partial [Marmoricola sp.]|nr:formate--tetrahydrofolate ligase [Marmoricola sp.]